MRERFTGTDMHEYIQPIHDAYAVEDWNLSAALQSDVAGIGNAFSRPIYDLISGWVQSQWYISR